MCHYAGSGVTGGPVSYPALTIILCYVQEEKTLTFILKAGIMFSPLYS